MLLFLSPHLDDAALSCGGLLARLAAKQTAVLAVTFFTGDHEAMRPLSPYAAHLHERWGNLPTPYADRRREDECAMARLGVPYRHLGFLDAIYRSGDREAERYADATELFSGQVPSWDRAIGEKVTCAIRELIAELGPEAVYTPAGVGRHVDHLIVRDSCLAAAGDDTAVIFYEDMPYSTGLYPVGRPDSPTRAILELGARAASIRVEPIDIEAKLQSVHCYRSQLSELSAGADFDLVIATYCRSAGAGVPAERYWSAV